MLQDKIIKALNAVYKKKNPKETKAACTKLRLWKSFSSDPTYLKSLDEKYRNFTETKVDAEPLISLTASEEETALALSEKIEFIPVASDEDIILVELIKKARYKTQPDTWTFRPLHATQEEQKEIEDHSIKVIPQTFSVQEILDSDLD